MDFTSVTSVSQVMNMAIPSADEVYDAIMGEIEEDLLTENLSHLDEKYAGESEEDKLERLARYDAAFAKYEEQFNTWISSLTEQLNAARRESLHNREEASLEEDALDLEDLESAFLSA